MLPTLKYAPELPTNLFQQGIIDLKKGLTDDILAQNRNTELENAPGGAWIKHYFPHVFSRPFTFYQNDFWNWVNTIEADLKPRPRFECEPRGVGKSSSARGAVVKLLAEQKKHYVLYICATDNQAQKHFNAIRKMLENEFLLIDYPHLRPAAQKHRPNVNKSWSSDRLVTDAGQVIEFISLMGNARGFTTEEGKRPDIFVFDDIDDSKDSPHMVSKKLNIIKYSILPARGENTLILFPQNLIHRDSICQQVRDQRADILSDRIFIGPYPLCRRYEAEKVDMDDGTGAKQWLITYYEPLDEAISKEYCQELLNEAGRDSFDRECQQMVFKTPDDVDFREWNELYHIITYSEFRRFFEKYKIPVWNDAKKHPQIPHNWNVGIGLDSGTTPGHPSAVAPIARPNQSAPLNDCFFAFTEIVLPKFPLQSGEEVPLVSPGRVALAIKTGLEEWNVSDDQIVMRVMSHEASSALLTMAIDLDEELKIFFNKWRAQKGSGVSQMQNLLEIDYSKKHPFKDFMGRPRIYFVVPDDQGEIITGDIGMTYVAQATDYKGLARARFEIPLYSHLNTGQNKVKDDYCLIAGTLIKTEYGDAPIENIQVGDRVWTRDGLRHVTNCGMTKQNAQTYSLITENGIKLTGTENHPIFTDKGIVGLRGIMPNDIIYVWKKKSLSLMESSFTDTQTLNSKLTVGIFSRILETSKKDFNIFTLKYGKMLLAMFLKTITSITKTTITTITIYPIWNVFLKKSIFFFIHTNGQKKVLQMNNSNIWEGLDQWRQNGTSQKKDENGIQNTVKRFGLKNFRKQKLVNTAETSFQQNPIIKNTAQISANGEKKTASVKRLFQRNVNLVGRFFKCLLLTLAKSYVNEVATEKHRVKSVNINRELSDVYNLTVSQNHEYFANEILVHNCDAIRGLMNVFGVSSQELTDEEAYKKHIEKNKPHLREQEIEKTRSADKRSQLLADLIQEKKAFEKKRKRKNIEQTDIAEYFLETEQEINFDFLGE